MKIVVFYVVLSILLTNNVLAKPKPYKHGPLQPKISADRCEKLMDFSSKDLLLDIMEKEDLGIGARRALKAFDRFAGITEVNNTLRYYRDNDMIRSDNFWEIAMLANKVSPNIFEIPEIYGSKVQQKADEEYPLANIPKEGPVILDGNHISGFSEAIVTAYAAVYGAGRKDIKILGNEILQYIFPEIKDQVLPLKIIGHSTPETRKHNARMMDEAKKWLAEGHLIMRYSAGTVSRLTSNLNPRDRKGALLEVDIHGRKIDKKANIFERVNHLGVFDPEWNHKQGQLILDSPEETKIVPIYSLGRNSKSFYSYSALNPVLRKFNLPENLIGLATLPKEYLKKKGSSVSLVIGVPISAKKFEGMEPQKIMNYLYTKTYLHAPQEKFDVNSKRLKNLFKKWGKKNVNKKRELPPLDREVLAREFDRLMEKNEKIYAQKKGFVSTIVRGSDLSPEMMFQLGLFRNHAFDTVNEGSKEISDTDEFDPLYYQQIIWDVENKVPAAVSRLVNTREFLERGEEYYTMKLFGVDPKFHEHLQGDVMDLGRTAIGVDYRNGKAAVGLLDLNFKSIGAFLYDNPSIHHVVGCVSFSNSYSPVALKISERFLIREFGPEDKRILDFINPQNPYNPKFKYLTNEVIDEYIDVDINGVTEKLEKFHPYSNTIKHIQLAQQNVNPELIYPPTLIRPYTVKFKTTVIAASMDKDFGSLDFMMMTDLRNFTGKEWTKLFGTERSVEDFKATEQSYLDTLEK